MRKRNRNRSDILNILIVVCTVTGIIILFAVNGPKGRLTAYGFANFRYYTVLSNVICGAVAAWYLHTRKQGREASRMLSAAKLTAAAAVGLTFLAIIAFFGPLYGHANLYHGSNLWFHLIVPVLAMIEFFLYDAGGILPMRDTVYAILPTILYGVCYAVNLFVNGIGVWPETNDWYGFVNWGYPVGFVIFGCITLATWGMACLLRTLNRAVRKARRPNG